MTTYAELQDRAEALIQDTALNTTISSLLNQGVQEIAGGMQSTLGDFITPPLPDLFSIDTVETSTSLAYVDLPTTFQRDLQLVVSANGTEIGISHTFISFIETYPDLSNSGSISEAVAFGGKIYYQGIPTVAEDLTLHFFRLPIDMDDDDDTPDGIPSHLHIPLLVNFAAWKAFEFVEDSIEGDAPNTAKYKGFFQEALRTLELSIPNNLRGLQLR